LLISIEEEKPLPPEELISIKKDAKKDIKKEAKNDPLKKETKKDTKS